MADKKRISQYSQKHLKALVNRYGEKSVAKSVGTSVQQIRNWYKGTGFTTPNDIRRINNTWRNMRLQKQIEKDILYEVERNNNLLAQIYEMNKDQSQKPLPVKKMNDLIQELFALGSLPENQKTHEIDKRIVEILLELGLDPHKSPDTYIRNVS